MHVLSRKESSALLSVLRGDEGRLLEVVGDAFQKQFPSETDRFRGCCALGLLLRDNVGGLRPTDRLFGAFCLLHSYRGKTSGGNPFQQLLLEIVTDANSGSDAERELVYQWLVEGRTGLGRRVSREGFVAQVKALPDVRRKRRDTGLRELLERTRASSKADDGVGCFAKAAINRAVLDTGNDGASLDPPVTDLGVLVPSKLGVGGFQPAFVRPVPPIFPSLESDVFWLNPFPSRELVWDCGLGSDNSNEVLVHSLIEKALEGPLMPGQQKQVLQELVLEPKLAYSCGLTPDSLPKLVENTPAIAYEILLRLTNSSLINDYLQVLVRMNMSLHSMEVVNRLASAVNLPVEFVHCYISNCIDSCNNVEDRYMQSRLVRLVCVFLQSLIKKDIINMQDLVHEVQAFCIAHSRIREAASLFRLLKQMEMGGGNSVSEDVSSEKSGQ
ncbi:hypothetical protein BSKO_11650 [Bryopsis sp. KO-2023]|nr:hypothetical protein BSKO_11650 [Bryopsis sp. KO-2023]